jgi:VCBS repeat-containing protein
VAVTIPDYRAVTIDAAVAGSFYHVKESDDSIAAVGDVRQALQPTNGPPTAHDDNYAMTGFKASLRTYPTRPPTAHDDPNAMAAGQQTLETTLMRFSGMPDVLRNDDDAEGDTLRAELVSDAAHGELTLRENGTFTYRPAEGFSGTDRFTYRALDFTHASEPATVTIEVTDELARVIDNDDEGFEDRASWLYSQTDGYQGDFNFYPAGSGGGTTATWTFEALPRGEYAVYAAWPQFSYQRPSRVAMEIFDGSTSRAQVNVNQNAPSRGEEFDGVAWKQLDTVEVASGTLKVTISNAARGRWVVADAVRIVPVNDAGEPSGEGRVIDNGDAGFTEQARWIAHDEGFDGDSRYLRGVKQKEREATATWTFDEIEPGVYELFATWPGGSNRTGVDYQVFDGEQAKPAVGVWQGRSPSDLLARGTQWASLGTFVVEEGPLRVVLSNHGRKANVMADAVALLPRGREPGPIIDDADERFSVDGPAEDIRHGLGDGAVRSSPTHLQGKTGVWNAGELAPGRYRVLATWFGYTNHCPQATYQVVAGDRTLAERTVDQTGQPDGPRFEGLRWNEIGVIDVARGTGPIEVRLGAPADVDGKLVFDAVYLQPIERQ